jgi:hypothetical protein
MKRQSLGCISHASKTNKYQAVFHDILINKPKHLGFYNSKLEAQEKIDSYIFDYYSINKFLLPKGICFDSKSRTFIYRISIKEKRHRVFYSKNLKEVIEFRLNFIRNLI